MELDAEQELLARLSWVAVPLVALAFSLALPGLLDLLDLLEADPSAYPRVVFYA